MRAALASLLVCLALGAGLAACGEVKDDTPVACLEPAAKFEAALEKAPGEVELSGDVPISGCLVENQNAGDLADVGETLIAAATKLNAEARAEPGGAANVELGYLLGAAQRGAVSAGASRASERTAAARADRLRSRARSR